MSQITLQLEHSVDVDVSPEFAWSYRTDIANWNDPPAEFAIHGPFQEGSHGTTLLPGQEPLHWRIARLLCAQSFTIEMQLDRATLSFEWSLHPAAGHQTKLTQRIILSGDNAAAYVAQVEAGFRPNLADGMRRLAALMETAAKNAEAS